LRLHEVNPQTLWFTDRPNRLGGVKSTQHFVDYWNKGADSFAENNPNASMVSVVMHGGKHGQMTNAGVFRLADPHYNAQSHVLTYSVQGIHHVNQSFAQEGKYHEVALFIDGCGFFGTNC
jgi:hypothetical protein